MSSLTTTNTASSFDAFLRTHFPAFVPTLNGERVSAGGVQFEKAVERVGRYWDEFVRFSGTAVVDADDLVLDPQAIPAFLLYRVCGVPGDDEGSGSCSLNTFRNAELLCLYTFLGRRYGFEEVSELVIAAQAGVHNVSNVLVKGHGETRHCVHAEPIYKCDMDRLISCLPEGLAGVREKCIFNLLSTYGLRGITARQMKLSYHVRQRGGRLELILPGVKTPNNIEFRVTPVDELRVDLERWLELRRQIYPQSDVLFITNTGKALEEPWIRDRLASLSECAGYGSGYFTCHSFRHGFVSTEAAKVYARGGTTNDVSDVITSFGQWSPNSEAARIYIDASLSRFFGQGLNLSFEEFCLLPPERIHALHPLHHLRIEAKLWQPLNADGAIVGLGVTFDRPFAATRGRISREERASRMPLSSTEPLREYLAPEPMTLPLALHLERTRGKRKFARLTTRVQVEHDGQQHIMTIQSRSKESRVVNNYIRPSAFQRQLSSSSSSAIADIVRPEVDVVSLSSDDTPADVSSPRRSSRLRAVPTPSTSSSSIHAVTPHRRC